MRAMMLLFFMGRISVPHSNPAIKESTSWHHSSGRCFLHLSYKLTQGEIEDRVEPYWGCFACLRTPARRTHWADAVRWTHYELNKQFFNVIETLPHPPRGLFEIKIIFIQSHNRFRRLLGPLRLLPPHGWFANKGTVRSRPRYSRNYRTVRAIHHSLQ